MENRNGFLQQRFVLGKFDLKLYGYFCKHKQFKTKIKFQAKKFSSKINNFVQKQAIVFKDKRLYSKTSSSVQRQLILFKDKQFCLKTRRLISRQANYIHYKSIGKEKSNSEICKLVQTF